MLMTDAWFDEYVFQIVADRKWVPKELVKIFEHGKATVLPPWGESSRLMSCWREK